jgi:uncharacterized membrane protein YwzB
MKQSYKIKFLILGCFVFGFLSLFFLIKPPAALAGTGNVTVGNACVTTPSDNCIVGLNCVGSVCVDPNSPPVPGSPTIPSLPSSLTPALTSPALPCPTGLTLTNGVCLPPSEYTTGIAGSTSLTDFILKLVKILLAFAGMIAVVMLVIGGYWYMAAGGNEEMSEKGKKTILNFVMGLVIIVLAYTIVSVIASTLTGADKLLQ